MRLLFTFYTFSVVISLLPWNSIHAQINQPESSAKTLLLQKLNNDNILTAFSQRFTVLDSLLNQTRQIDDLPLSAYSFSTNALDSVYEAQRVHERKAFKRKTGLELTGQAYQRLDDELGFDEDNDQYSSYNTKFQGEIGWNFFNSSFLQRKTALRLIDLGNQAEWLQQKGQHTEQLWNDAENAIERRYNVLTVAVLHQQLQNIDVLNMAYQFTLENDRTGNEKLLDAMSEKMRIEHAIAQVEGEESMADGRPNGNLERISPVVIEVDSAKLFDYILNQNPEIQATHIQEAMLGAKRKLTNYAHEMRFTPFFRASHYLRTSMPSSTNTEVGVRFTFPSTTTRRRSARRCLPSKASPHWDVSIFRKAYWTNAANCSSGAPGSIPPSPPNNDMPGNCTSSSTSAKRLISKA